MVGMLDMNETNLDLKEYFIRLKATQRAFCDQQFNIMNHISSGILNIHPMGS